MQPLKTSWFSTGLVSAFLGFACIACGGSPTKSTPQADHKSHLNVIQVDTQVGSTVRVQLWISNERLSEESQGADRSCPKSVLHFTLNERTDATGLILEGFPKEVHKQLRTLTSTPRCLSSMLKAEVTPRQRDTVSKLIAHLENDGFELAVLVGRAQSNKKVYEALRGLVSSRDNFIPTRPPLPQANGPTIETHQTQGLGHVTFQFSVPIETAQQLADLDLAVSALQNALQNKLAAIHKDAFSDIQVETQHTQGGLLVNVRFKTPTSQLKQQLPRLASHLTNKHGLWASPLDLVHARSRLALKLKSETNLLKNRYERIARTTLRFGWGADQRWKAQLMRVGHFKWFTNIQSWFVPRHLKVIVSLSRETLGEPGFEIAFFQESLNESLQKFTQTYAPPVASTQARKLVHLHRKTPEQTLRLIVGLPSISLSTLTPEIEQAIKRCLHTQTNRAMHVDFEGGVLGIQATFQPSNTDQVLGEWQDLVLSSCSPIAMASAKPNHTTTLDPLHHLIRSPSFEPTSTGTAIRTTNDSLMAKRWWRTLFALKPPTQFFATGPLGTETLAPQIRRWTEVVETRAWDHEGRSLSASGQRLRDGISVFANGKLFVPFKGRSPRRRILLDAICEFLKQHRSAPSHCARFRSPYLAGIDILMFTDLKPGQPQKLGVRLKTFLLQQESSINALHIKALRQAVLMNEQEIHAPKHAVKWLQKNVWEPGAEWREKLVSDGLFPQETDTEEFMVVLEELVKKKL